MGEAEESGIEADLLALRATCLNVRKLERATSTAVTAVHGALGPPSRPCAAGAGARSARGDHRIPDAVGRIGTGVEYWVGSALAQAAVL